MCQLIFASTSNLALQRLCVYFMMKNDTITNNKDGYGILLPGAESIIKNPTDFNDVNFSDTLMKFGKGSEVIAHVRAAFSGIGGKKTGVEFNHPFIGNDFVLAHNGVLSYKDKNKEPEKDKIDSQIFLGELDTMYEKVKEFPKAIVDTMEMFQGKFAFLIYHKSTKQYYAVRGKTANLHLSYLYNDTKEQIGYLINTDEKSLKLALKDIETVYAAFRIKMGYSEPKLLKEESIFLLEKDNIKLIGEIKESEPPKVYAGVTVWSENDLRGDYGENYDSRFYARGYQSQPYQPPAYTHSYHTPYTPPLLPEPKTPVIKKELPCYQVLDDVLRFNLLRYRDLMAICFFMFDKSALSLNETELKELTETVQKLCKRNTKKHKALWRKIIEVRDEDAIYNTLQFEFPYFFNDLSKLHSLKRTYANTIV